MSLQEETILQGVAVSVGIGIGPPLFFSSVEEGVEEVSIGKKEIDSEIDRFRRALDRSRKDVEGLQKISQQEGPSEIHSILDTHLEMMQDPLLTSVIEERIRDKQRNTESVFHHTIEEYKGRLNKERVCDNIADVARRVLGHLRPIARLKMGD